MKEHQEETPPSSHNGDEIETSHDDNEFLLEDAEEVVFDAEDMEDEEMEMPIVDDAAMLFDKHTGSVFCCHLHPSGKAAVTGGEDDKAYVWSPQTGEVLWECDGFSDSVIFAEFSFDGIYLACGDMAGLIKVWKCNLENKEPWTSVFEYETDDLNWGMWHKAARVVICGTLKGEVYVLKISSGESKILKSENSKVECGKLFPDGRRLAVGYEDGGVKIWDIKTEKVLQQLPPATHEMRVTDLDTALDNNVVASISTDGKVILTLSTTGKIIGQIDAEDELEVVAFNHDPELGYLALGTLTGSVTIWDAARKMLRYRCTEEDNFNGVTKMMWVKNELVVGWLNGSVKVYEGRSGKELSLMVGHTSEILDLSCNREHNLILTSSNDGARIFDYIFGQA